MATTGVHLVDKLPLRLRNFLARYPPQIYSAQVAPRPPPPGPEQLAQLNDSQNSQTPVATSPTELENAPEKSPYHPNRDAKGHPRPNLASYYSPSRALLYNNPDYPNPFLPQKNRRNGKWLGPRLGLRQQADLVKLAVKYNVEGLLPPGRKSTEFKETKRAERGGLAVKGTGIGQKVKGHKWERTMEARLEDRRKAMVEMPEMIRLWKQVSFLSFLFFSLLVGRIEDANVVYREVMDVAGSSGQGGNNRVKHESCMGLGWSFYFTILLCFPLMYCTNRYDKKVHGDKCTGKSHTLIDPLTQS